MRWNDEYWPLLIKIYKKKPEGVKPLYSRLVVETALNLHIPPQELHRKMQELRKLDTPHMQKMWKELSGSSHKLNKTVKTILQKEGYGTSGKFFDGIVTKESWELDFRPIDVENRLMPIHLILILDLYFQLTPTTMVADTVDIQDLGKLIKLPVSLVLEVMETFKQCDPYLVESLDLRVESQCNVESLNKRLFVPCKEVWNRFGNNDIEALSLLASQLKNYFAR